MFRVSIVFMVSITRACASCSRTAWRRCSAIAAALVQNGQLRWVAQSAEPYFYNFGIFTGLSTQPKPGGDDRVNVGRV